MSTEVYIAAHFEVFERKKNLLSFCQEERTLRRPLATSEPCNHIFLKFPLEVRRIIFFF
jgi:hypothetical protein